MHREHSSLCSKATSGCTRMLLVTAREGKSHSRKGDRTQHGKPRRCSGPSSEHSQPPGKCQLNSKRKPPQTLNAPYSPIASALPTPLQRRVRLHPPVLRDAPCTPYTQAFRAKPVKTSSHTGFAAAEAVASSGHVQHCSLLGSAPAPSSPSPSRKRGKGRKGDRC